MDSRVERVDHVEGEGKDNRVDRVEGAFSFGFRVPV